MSLVLDLEIPNLDWDLAEELIQKTTREGVLRVIGSRRRRWFRGKPSLRVEESLDDGTCVIDEAEVDAGNYAAISPAYREALASTLLLIAEAVEPGWCFHAGWVSDWEREIEVKAAELAELARHSQLDAAVRYCVH